MSFYHTLFEPVVVDYTLAENEYLVDADGTELGPGSRFTVYSAPYRSDGRTVESKLEVWNGPTLLRWPCKVEVRKEQLDV